VVYKTQAQMTDQKKSTTAKSAKVAAAALLTQSAATPSPVAGINAAPTLPAAAPSQDKLKAVNLAKLVMEQLRLAMRADMATLDGCRRGCGGIRSVVCRAFSTPL
jgi:hypothetical protein